MQQYQGWKRSRLRVTAALLWMSGMFQMFVSSTSASVVIPVPDDGFRSVWYEWKKTVGDQLDVLETEEENASIWNAVPKAVSVMLLKYGEENLYNRMFAEEDGLLAAYAESGQPVPDEVVFRLKDMIGRYADARSEIGLKKNDLERGWVIVSSAEPVFINPDKDFRKSMAMELSDLFFTYRISKRLDMSDSELTTLFLRRARERSLIWKKRRATTLPEQQQTVAVPRMFGGDHEFPYANFPITSITQSFHNNNEYTTTPR